MTSLRDWKDYRRRRAAFKAETKGGTIHRIEHPLGHRTRHTYRIVDGKAFTTIGMDQRWKIVAELYPENLTSLLDIGCCRGWFVVQAMMRPECEMALGIDVVQVFIDWLSVPQYVADEKLPLVTDFLKFITSQDNAIALNEVVGFTPVRTDAWESIRANSAVWDTMLGLSEEYGRAFADIRASAELRPLITEQVTLFLTDQQSLEDTQTNLKEEYDAILEDNGFLG